MEQSSTTVVVSNENAPAAVPLVVKGYDVSGEVQSDSEPMKGVSFLLYSASVTQEDINGCNVAPVDGALVGDPSLVYLCSSQSREDGTFSFPCWVDR
ncbi:nodal modulator 3-like [Sinocyclocheilus rhinocerous]|uniref:nodal modulator 3-like n=1 Tax=Sinocyclocheilus rhinocerous TaxID=307959 RepID=UPI0007B9F97B|nr:PREDICTED: nodal modulator 3-like [Sinocyclocheilus rhinocerous]